MTIRLRATLIVCGAIIFVLLAPMLVLAARGYYFDFDSWQLVKTGALIVNSNPSGAKVFLNDDDIGTTRVVKRFLLPGDYDLRVEKSGYRPWQKSISVFTQKITSFPNVGDSIYLLLAEPARDEVATSSIDFFPQAELLAEKYFIATTTNALMTGNGDAIETVISNLPPFEKSQIVSSPSREIFLLLDDALYQVADKALNKINTHVSYARWNSDTDALVYGNDHEIWLWEPLGQTQNILVTRSSDPIGSPIYAGKIGYFFYASAGKITAMEFDPVYKSNVYQIAETKQTIAPLRINADETEVQWIDDGKLMTLTIR